MKRYSSIFLVLIIIFMLPACHMANIVEIGNFSYQKDMSIYKSEIVHAPANSYLIEITTAEEAIAEAQKECTVTYDTIKVYQDKNENMWKVLFYTTGALGGSQAVYLDDTGKFRFNYYGE